MERLRYLSKGNCDKLDELRRVLVNNETPMVAIFAGLLLLTGIGEPSTPGQESLDARGIRPIQTTFRVWEPAEFVIDLKCNPRNPFDPNELDAKVVIETPSGRTLTQSAFYYQSYRRSLVDQKEILEAAGPAEWRARISFLEVGKHRLSLIAKGKTRSSTSPTIELDVEPSTSTGFINVSKRDPKYFETSSGESFFPLGSNVCWGGDPGTYSYDTWLPKYGAQGCNFIRVWLNPGWTTFGIEQAGEAKDKKGIGYLSSEALWKLDYTMALARKHGLRVKICIDSYNMLRDKDAYPYWEKSAYNRTNAGPLDFPSQFWQDRDADEAYRAKLKYLIARYSADPTVFAWEFWNEVDLTREFSVEKVKGWHQRMAREIRKQDLYNHMITTSFSETMGFREIDQLAEIDFIQTHNYNSPDVVTPVAVQQSRKGSWGKPHYVSEIGADFEGPREKDDPLGLQIHDPLWSSIAMGSSGGAMPWWWDSHIEPFNLYPLFGAAARFVAGVDWVREGFRQTQPEILYQTPPAIQEGKDLVFANGPAAWTTSEYNQPRTVKISDKGAEGDLPLSSYLHGQRNHPDWQNPVTFRTDLSKKTRLDLVIDQVSGFGGAHLIVTIDGQQVTSKVFADPDDNEKTDSLNQYRGRYSIDIPVGKHTVVIKNSGNDWIKISYRFDNFSKRTTPPILGWATTGERTVLCWLRHEDRTWTRVCVDKEKIRPAAPAMIRLPGLANGKWKVELWDTWTGKVTSEFQLTVSLDGFLKVPIPSIATDIAFKAVLVK